MLGGAVAPDREVTQTQSGTETSGDAGSETKLGVFAGYDFPLFVRAWASYFLDISREDADGNESNTDSIDGVVGLGVGFTFLPLVSLNVEYRTFQYNSDGS